jgi:hypothetical protein
MTFRKMEDGTIRDEMTERQMEVAYSALNKSTEYWAIAAGGPFAFRFGPYTAPEIGEIMQRSVDEGLAISFVGVCGREFDWALARDLCARVTFPDKEDKT